MGTVLNIRGQNHKYNQSVNPDDTAISIDWHMIGQDIRDALKRAEAEIGNRRAHQ